MSVPYENEAEAVEEVRYYIYALNEGIDKLRRIEVGGVYTAAHEAEELIRFIVDDYKEVRGDLSVTDDNVIQKKPYLRYALRHAKLEALAEVGKEMARLLENA